MSNRTDTFNRTDSGSSLGTPSDAGSAWVAAAGTWGINTNQAANVTGGTNDVAYLESSISDVEVQVTVPLFVTGGYNDQRVIARFVDTSNYLLFRAKSTGWDLYKVVAGSFTQMFDVGGSPADNDVMKMSCSGSTIKCYVNGVQKGTDQTVTDGQTNTKHGIGATGRFEDFSITLIAAAASAAPVSLTHTQAARRASFY